MTLSPDCTIRARYVFPIDQSPIPNAAVQIARGRIIGIDPHCDEVDYAYDNAAILPGLVNAHTHLELSSIRAGAAAAPDFISWLKRLIKTRRQISPVGTAHAIQRGIDDLLSAGVTLVGDISTAGQSWRPLLKSPLRAVVFCELLGLLPERAFETYDAARELLDSCIDDPTPLDPDSPSSRDLAEFCAPEQITPLPSGELRSPLRRLIPSLSPHAPYSTHQSLYSVAGDWAKQCQIPVCTHLAETPAELEFIRSGGGAFEDFLKSISAWNPQWQPAGKSALDWLDLNAPWVVAHANYLSEVEVNRLAESRASIVYCPRTHRYFGHPTHPYRDLLRAGVNVCLGTDSLASTPSLSVLAEMRFLRKLDPSLDGGTILRMATLNGAQALGVDDRCGSITEGKSADLSVVRIPDSGETDPARLILQSDEPVLATWVEGRKVFQRVG